MTYHLKVLLYSENENDINKLKQSDVEDHVHRVITEFLQTAKQAQAFFGVFPYSFDYSTIESFHIYELNAALVVTFVGNFSDRDLELELYDEVLGGMLDQTYYITPTTYYTLEA